MLTTKIFPVNVAIHNQEPKRFLSGLVYSEEELDQLKDFCKEKHIYLTVAYRNEDLLRPDETNIESRSETT